MRGKSAGCGKPHIQVSRRESPQRAVSFSVNRFLILDRSSDGGVGILTRHPRPFFPSPSCLPLSPRPPCLGHHLEQFILPSSVLVIRGPCMSPFICSLCRQNPTSGNLPHTASAPQVLSCLKKNNSPPPPRPRETVLILPVGGGTKHFS